MPTNEELAQVLDALVSRAAILNDTRWRGYWDGRTTYAFRDLVYHTGRTYMSLTSENIGHMPAQAGVALRWWSDISVYITQVSGGDGDGGGAEGSVEPGPGLVPEAGDDGTLEVGWLPPWQQLSQWYASPEGDDDLNDGKSWEKPKRTIYGAIQASGGGGWIHVDEGCEVGAPDGAGIELRCDNMPEGYPTFLAAPGALPLAGPLRITGYGQRKSPMPFNNRLQAGFTGGGGWRHPKIHIAGSSIMSPVMIENLQLLDPVEAGIRVGIDYDRNVNGTVREIPVTNATRVGNSTTYTLDLTNFGFAVTHAERADNVMSIYITNPGLPWPPFHKGVPITFNSTDEANFPSGVYTIIAQNNWEGGPTAALNWYFNVVSVGADIAKTAIAGSEMFSHGCAADDIGTLEPLPGFVTQFAGMAYFITAVTEDTVTVEDDFGDGDRDEDNIGTFAHQDRSSPGTACVEFTNVYSSCNNSNFGTYPAWDFGRNIAKCPVLINCSYTGYVGDHGLGPRNERNYAGIYCYAGTSSNDTGSSIEMKDSSGNGGPILVEARHATTVNIDLRRLLNEGNEFRNQPSLIIDGTGKVGGATISCIVEDVYQADTIDNNLVNIDLISVDYAEVRRSANVSGPCIGGDGFQTPHQWKNGNQLYPNPWTKFQVTAWAGGRITGIHPSGPRSLGAVTPRFVNQVDPPSTWLPGADITQVNNVEAPDGSFTATRLSSSTLPDSTIIRQDGGMGDVVFQVGGRWVFGSWVRSANFAPSVFAFATTGGIMFSNGLDSFNVSTPYSGDGWQFIQGYEEIVAAATSTPNVTMYAVIGAGGALELWGPTAVYVPPTVHNNDFFEYLGTLRHQPFYPLQPGDTGTMDRSKFIAHGGIGTGLAYVAGVGSGQVTIAGSFTPKKYEPIYDAQTGAIKGWAELLDGAVNP